MALQRVSVQFLVSTWQLTTFSRFRSRESDTLFWSLPVQYAHGAQVYMEAQPIYIK